MTETKSLHDGVKATEADCCHEEGVCSDEDSATVEAAVMLSSCSFSDNEVSSCCGRSDRESTNSVPATLFPVSGSTTRPTLYTISDSSCFTCLDLGSGRALRRTMSPTVHCRRASWAKYVFLLL